MNFIILVDPTMCIRHNEIFQVCKMRWNHFRTSIVQIFMLYDYGILKYSCKENDYLKMCWNVLHNNIHLY